MIGAIYGKVLDGTDLMSHYDPHGRAYGSMEMIREIGEREHQEHGRGFVPWSVPHGLDPETEGRLNANAAIAGAGHGERATMILNIEPYEGFWLRRGAESKDALRRLMSSFRENGGEEIWLWVDARAWQLRDTNFDHWLSAGEGLVTRILPEVYWTDFLRREPTDNDVRFFLNRAVALLGEYGVEKARVFPTLPSPSTPEQMVLGIEYCHGLGTGRPNLWQRVNLSRETALAVAGMDDPWLAGGAAATGDDLDTGAVVVDPDGTLTLADLQEEHDAELAEIAVQLGALEDLSDVQAQRVTQWHAEHQAQLAGMRAALVSG